MQDPKRKKGNIHGLVERKKEEWQNGVSMLKDVEDETGVAGDKPWMLG